MTEEYKNILITRMLNSPDTLSAEDTAYIIQDDELKDIYEISRQLHNACRPQPTIDAAVEWHKFRPRLAQARRRRLIHTAIHAAAILTGILLLAGAITFITNRPADTMPQPEILAKAGSAILHTSTHGQPHPHAEVALTPAQPEAKKAHVDRHPTTTAEEVDVEEYLRLMQARIDNDIAMQTAETRADTDNNYIIMP